MSLRTHHNQANTLCLQGSGIANIGWTESLGCLQAGRIVSQRELLNHSWLRAISQFSLLAHGSGTSRAGF